MSKADDNNKRDGVLRRMLKTPPSKHQPVGKRKPNVPTQEELERMAEEMGQNDLNAKLEKPT